MTRYGRLALQRIATGALVVAGLAASPGQAVTETSRSDVAKNIAASMAQSAELSSTVYSAHVWRGQVRNRSTALHTTLTTKPHPALILGGNALVDASRRDAATGTLVSTAELSIFYMAPPFGPLKAGIGLVERLYPGTTTKVPEDGPPPFDRKRATEGVLTLNLRSFLAPYVDAYLDLRNPERLYTALGLGHLWLLTPELPTMEIAASLAFANAAYNQAQFALDQAALNDGVVSLLLRKEVDPSNSIILELTYSRMLDQRLRSALDTPDRLYGGIGWEVRF